MTRTLSTLSALALAVTLAACGGGNDSDDCLPSSTDTGSEPLAACTLGAGPGVFESYGGGCLEDSDCDAPLKCMAAEVGGKRCYLPCTSDTDCRGVLDRSEVRWDGCNNCGSVAAHCLMPELIECRNVCTTDSQCNTGCCLAGACESALACEAPSCLDEGAVCSSNGECCGFASGAAFCARFSATGGYTCAPTCTSDADCASGCCVALDNDESVCGPASSCSGSTSAPPRDRCGDCLDSCSGLPSCCTGTGCFCEDECAVSSCSPPYRLCCNAYFCLCKESC